MCKDDVTFTFLTHVVNSKFSCRKGHLRKAAHLRCSFYSRLADLGFGILGRVLEFWVVSRMPAPQSPLWIPREQPHWSPEVQVWWRTHWCLGSQVRSIHPLDPWSRTRSRPWRLPCLWRPGCLQRRPYHRTQWPGPGSCQEWSALNSVTSRLPWPGQRAEELRQSRPSSHRHRWRAESWPLLEKGIQRIDSSL